MHSIKSLRLPNQGLTWQPEPGAQPECVTARTAPQMSLLPGQSRSRPAATAHRVKSLVGEKQWDREWETDRNKNHRD